MSFCIDLLKPMFGRRAELACRPGITLDEACIELEQMRVSDAIRARQAALQALRGRLREMPLDARVEYLFLGDRRAAGWVALKSLETVYEPRTRAELLGAELIRGWVKGENPAADLRSIEKLVKKTPIACILAFTAYPVSQKEAIKAFGVLAKRFPSRGALSEAIAESVLSWPVRTNIPKRAAILESVVPRDPVMPAPRPARPPTLEEQLKAEQLARVADRVRAEQRARDERQMRLVQEERAKHRR